MCGLCVVVVARHVPGPSVMCCTDSVGEVGSTAGVERGSHGGWEACRYADAAPLLLALQVYGGTLKQWQKLVPAESYECPKPQSTDKQVRSPTPPWAFARAPPGAPGCRTTHLSSYWPLVSEHILCQQGTPPPIHYSCSGRRIGAFASTHAC